jgi:phosphoglycerol transferase MdoB-like AlkP superfamily enzyme
VSCWQNTIYQKEYKRISTWAGLNLLLYVTIECISSLDLLERAIYLAGHLDIFLMNYILLLIITCPCLLFPKMTFVFNLFAFTLLTLTYASRISMGIRGMPLTWGDFFIVGEGLSIANKYLSLPMVTIMFVLISTGLALLTKSYSHRLEIYHPKAVICFILLITSLNLAIVSQAEKNEKVEEKSSIDVSEEGIVYSLVSSYEAGADAIMENYSKDKVLPLKADLQKRFPYPVSNKNPNIIILQLESFIDPYSLKGVHYSKDPIPYMRKQLTGEWSGHVEVPGINTARTEFEVLTGMRIAHLFPFEVPYTSKALDGRAIESVAHLLKKTKNYHTTAIHNHEASFYDRDKVYSYLGFDHFIPVEYMEHVKYSKNWPKDDVLFPYITQTIERTPNRDLVYAVAVATHSSYDYEYENPASDIVITGEAAEETLNQVQDYIDRLEETDRFVGELIDYIENSKEPIVLIAYGDHIPALDVLTYDKGYVKDQTPYFIFSNYVLRGKPEPVLPTYQLYTKLLNTVGIQGGIISSVHNALREDKDYFDKLDVISYDLLMGNYYITQEKNNYQVTDLKFGKP